MTNSPFYLLLADFAHAANLPAPPINDQGVVVLQADKLTAYLKPSEGVNDIELFAAVGRLAPTPPQDLLEDILQANLAWQDTRGATLGLDRKTRMLMLSDRRPLLGLSIQDFQRLLEGFLQTLEHWTQVLKDRDGSATVASATEMELGMRV